MKRTIFKNVASMLMLALAVGMANIVRAETVTYDFTRLYAPYLTSTETTIWENRNIADIELLKCKMNGGWIASAKAGIGVIYDRTPTSFTVQFQCKEGQCKTVRAYFRQDGANIVARADKAGYADGSYFGTRIPDPDLWREIATSDSSGTYGATEIEAFSVDQVVDALPADADAVVVNGGILQVNVNSDTTISTTISSSLSIPCA